LFDTCRVFTIFFVEEGTVEHMLWFRFMFDEFKNDVFDLKDAPNAFLL